MKEYVKLILILISALCIYAIGVIFGHFFTEWLLK